jgi:hypothetical protein
MMRYRVSNIVLIESNLSNPFKSFQTLSTSFNPQPKFKRTKTPKIMSFTITPTKMDALKASFVKISTQESKNTDASWTDDLETFTMKLFAKIEELSAKKVQRAKKPKNEDPDRLKRPVPASWMWRDENREQIVEDHFSGEKVKGSEVAKKAMELWKEMSEEEQEPWVTKRQELWDAYKAENPSRTSSSPKSPFNVDKDVEVEVPEGWNGPHEGKFLRGFAAGRAVGVGKFETFAEAVEAAKSMDKCGGITYDEKRGYTLRVACDPEQIVEDEIHQISWAKENHTVKREKKTRGKKEKKADVAEVEKKAPAALEAELFGSDTDEEEEVEDGRVTPKIARCMDEEDASGAGPAVEADESDEEEEMEVAPWEYKGVTYLLDEKTGDVYDYDEQELVGKKGEGKFKEKMTMKVVKGSGK